MLLNSEEISIDGGVLLLRVSTAGTLLWQHGWPKLAHFSDKMDTFGDPIGLGPAVSLGLITFAETVCAALVALGLWTRISTIPCIIGMAVAAFMANGDAPFAKKELAVLYLCGFLAILLTGSGRFSLDRLKFQ
ncbi:MAG TPA: DoxX family protein [Flavobacteriales bacterium]|nr:DoxX family protein [Flavobacteriales bacterium]